MPKQIPYGIANYEEFLERDCYFVDKTAYIETLERVSNPIFLRPRKFGKSLWCRILECYYSIQQKDRFDDLFGHTYIGQHPTKYRIVTDHQIAIYNSTILMFFLEKFCRHSLLGM